MQSYQQQQHSSWDQYCMNQMIIIIIIIIAAAHEILKKNTEIQIKKIQSLSKIKNKKIVLMSTQPTYLEKPSW